MAASSTLPPVRVRLFARYAELLGREAIDLPPDGLDSVADVVRAIRDLPGGRAIPEHPLIAVNLEQADEGRPVHAGDEVAVLPPLAGG